MSKEEKILMIKLLLEDIRGNWGWENGDRTLKAKELALELFAETNEKVWIALIDTIETYDGEDGRYFRNVFPAGYLGMETLYNISETYQDKTEDFKSVVEEYITYPENCFNDYE